MTTATLHKCKNGCGWTHHYLGAMNLHHRFHCPKLKKTTLAEEKNPSGSKATGITKNQKQKNCDCADGGTFRFLNKEIPHEAACHAHGFRKICDECDEVI